MKELIVLEMRDLVNGKKDRNEMIGMMKMKMIEMKLMTTNPMMNACDM